MALLVSLLVAAVIVGVTVGYGPSRGHLPQSTVRITPIKALVYDEKVLIEPTDLSGAVRVEYAGPKPHLHIWAEVWREDEGTTTKHFLQFIPLDPPTEGNLFVSVRTERVLSADGRWMQMVRRLRVVWDGQSRTFNTIQLPRSLFPSGFLAGLSYEEIEAMYAENVDTSWHPLERYESVSRPDDEEIIVWGIIREGHGDYSTPLAERVKASVWAVVVKVKFEDPPPPPPSLRRMQSSSAPAEQK